MVARPVKIGGFPRRRNCNPPHPAAVRALAPFLPGFVTGLIARGVVSVYKDDVAQDFVIWESHAGARGVDRRALVVSGDQQT
jgi:hypothetical protein